MSITFIERPESGAGDLTKDGGQSLVLKFVAVGSNDRETVQLAALAYFPPTAIGMGRKKIAVTLTGSLFAWVDVEYNSDTAEDQGAGNEPPDEPETPSDEQDLGAEYAIDTSGYTEHITQSLMTRYKRALGDSGSNLTIDAADNTKVTPDGRTPTANDVGLVIHITAGSGFTAGDYTITAVSGGKWTLSSSPGAVGITGGEWIEAGVGNAPDNKNAIGLTADGKVEGCDRYTGKLTFTQTVKRKSVRLPYIRSLADATGTTNKAKWKEFDGEHVLYLGAKGNGTTRGEWTLSHDFALGRKRVNENVGTIIVPLIMPHDHVWVSYETVTFNHGTILAPVLQAIQIPAAVYVEQIYASSDFSKLELGT